ncbi:MAG: type II toxin-antitoxin system VapC family toxin [Planctomycetes bacterium]|nr:type II toxin-antitoxin system VapC family toxin [Planctomycetota bacterium]
MADTVYIETTVIGHLVGRKHPDAAIAVRQQITRDWWADATRHYRILISEIVRDECGAGDPIAAKERLDAIDSLSLLEVNEEVLVLANSLMTSGAVPPSEPRDALHIAISAVNGIQYLVTWNYKHIANAAMRSRIESVCRSAGFEPPIICTPEELTGK